VIVDVMKSSLGRRSQLIPVEALSGNCAGSRMPEVCPDLLTAGGAQLAADVCPTAALALERQAGTFRLRLDYGKCIGCGRCHQAAPEAFIPAGRFTLCGVTRDELIRSWDLLDGGEVTCTATPESVRAEIHSFLGRALNVRQLDPGSCNGCEAEITALTNPCYDLERFGIHFVASPKHADMLLVTGPVTRNMAEAVRNTYAAVPEPKLVVAVGACGVSGGLFASSHAVVGPVSTVIPVDGYIPGCPPTPAMLVAGILEVVKRHSRRSRPSGEVTRRISAVVDASNPA
jgi:Ni,Fe-hydrogenase III small subunit/ferredoxin